MRRARRHDDDRGASLVELALIAPVMVLIVFGVIDLSRGYRMQIRLENAAREGAAYAQINPNRVSCTSASDPAGTDDIKDRVLSEDAGLDDLPGYDVSVWTDREGWSDMGLEITGCDQRVGGNLLGDAGDRVRVDVEARFDVMTPMVEQIVGSTIDLVGSAQVVVQG